MLPDSFRLVRCLRASFAMALLACCAGQAQAGSSELQVYRDDMPDKGEYNLEFSTGLLKHAARSELKGLRQLSALAELSYGYSDEWEVGVKLPIYQIHQQWHASGLTGEVRYIATHQQQGWYLGAELELGYQSPYHEQRQWLLELTPIIGYRLGNWHFTANPGLALASRGDEQGELMFEPSARLAYQVTAQNAIAIEYFAETGPLHAPLPQAKRYEVAYLNLATRLGKHQVQFGVGRGLTGVSPRWAAKLNAEIEFD